MKNFAFVKIKEGSSEFYIHTQDKDSIPSKSMNVFYNKKMIINRDISNLAILAYKKLYNQTELIIVDSMAASGISAIRILNECEDVKKIYINDINPSAIDLIKKNLKLNNLNNITSRVCISRKDANFLFSEIAQKGFLNSKNQENPNIISIDPFGTPNLYIDSAFKAIKNEHGLMCITATDTAVLFGIKINACIRKYMAKPLHNQYCKEIGARILIYFISRIANINNLGIKPLLTFYSNHFIRVFALTFKNKEQIENSFNKYGYLIECVTCGNNLGVNNSIFFKCPFCNDFSNYRYAGPLWLGELHDDEFIKEILIINNIKNYDNQKRINKILNLTLEENHMPPFYYNIHKISQFLKLSEVPKLDKIITTIKEKGYRASRTHFDFLSIKTDIRFEILKKILKII